MGTDFLDTPFDSRRDSTLVASPKVLGLGAGGSHGGSHAVGPSLGMGDDKGGAGSFKLAVAKVSGGLSKMKASLVGAANLGAAAKAGLTHIMLSGLGWVVRLSLRGSAVVGRSGL